MSKRVLIVDDSPIILAAVRSVLVDAGFAVETRNGVEDLGSANPDEFDLILMDVQMPEMFGDDVAMVFRERGVRAKLYLFSTLPEDELAERTREAGLDGYISKGRSTDHLVAEVRRILA